MEAGVSSENRLASGRYARAKSPEAAAAGPGLWNFRNQRLLTDDRGLHRPEDAEQLALFLFGNLELIERFDQILDQRIELRVGDTHPGVRRLHVAAGIGAGAAGALTNLFDQQPFQPRDVGPGEESVDAGVGRDVADEVVDNRCNRRLAAEAVVERLLLHWHHAHVLARAE